MIAVMVGCVIWWRRRDVFDAPVIVRFGLSITPGIVLYKALLLIYRGLTASRYPVRNPLPLIAFLIFVAGIVCPMLYKIWREIARFWCPLGAGRTLGLCHIDIQFQRV